jgi:RNA polymerase sigma-70 factor (ECF subfamily)
MGFGPADADDILQEVCLRVVKQPAEYRSDNEATQWLVKVTMNLCLLEHRQRRRFEKKTSEILLRRRNQSTNGSTEQTLTKDEELEAVREAMREMDGTILAALTLRYFAGLNSTEVGETLGINASTVRSRLREGRMLLAEKLLRRGVGPQ